MIRGPTASGAEVYFGDNVLEFPDFCELFCNMVLALPHPDDLEGDEYQSVAIRYWFVDPTDVDRDRRCGQSRCELESPPEKKCRSGKLVAKTCFLRAQLAVLGKIL